MSPNSTVVAGPVSFRPIWRCRVLATAGLVWLGAGCAPYPGSIPSTDVEAQRAARRSDALYSAVAVGADSLARHAQGVVAVLHFPMLGAGPHDPLAEEVREIVTTRLGSRTGLALVERSQIEQVQEEYMYLRGLENWDDDAAARAGRELGASLVALGAIIPVGASGLRVHMRLVDVVSKRLQTAYVTAVLARP